ncbi:hypothetical protein VTK26DRAFT_5822 [Humicola hyalothermophila]
MPTPTLAEVIFPEQANQNFSRILGDLKRSNLSITNRLRSIEQDASFVEDVAAALSGLPLIANERCGSWYIDPARKAGSAYFKSTDGHTGQWKFSTRRLNLHLLELIGSSDGCIIVDSTRRGKRMPDALSKTVPIWCTVLNRALFPDHDAGSLGLFVPPSAVSASEANQIEARIPEFVNSFRALAIDVAPLRKRLKKPLRPVWVTQEDYAALVGGGGADDEDDEGAAWPLKSALGLGEISAEFHPVVCCTSSRRVVGTGAEIGEAEGYIQGAGDDTENWARGLTAPVFWRHKSRLLATPESELPGLIAELLTADEAEKRRSAAAAEVKPAAPGLFVGTLAAAEAVQQQQQQQQSSSAGSSCVIMLVPKTTDKESWVKSPSRMEVGVGKTKVASRMLRDALPQICEFVSRYLSESSAGRDDGHSDKRVVILCESGKDLSVGVALAVYCWCFDASGNVRAPDGDRESFTKTAIRVKLGQIVTALPEANPSRATLQSVNSYLMDWRN